MEKLTNPTHRCFRIVLDADMQKANPDSVIMHKEKMKSSEESSCCLGNKLDLNKR